METYGPPLDEWEKDQLLINAMHVKLDMREHDLEVMRRNGPNYGPWKKLTRAFFAANPDWTPQQWARIYGRHGYRPAWPPERIESWTTSLGCIGMILIILFLIVWWTGGFGFAGIQAL